MTSSSAWIEPGMRTAGAIGGPLVELFRRWLASSHRAARYAAIDAGSDLDPHHDVVATDEDDVDAPWIDRDALLEAMAMQASELRWRARLARCLISAGFNGGKRHLVGQAMSC